MFIQVVPRLEINHSDILLTCDLRKYHTASPSLPFHEDRLKPSDGWHGFSYAEGYYCSNMYFP